MSPAWWEGNPIYAENLAEGRALRLLRRFLSEEQREMFDMKARFFVRGKRQVYLFVAGNHTIYRVAPPAETQINTSIMLMEMAPVTHSLCVQTVEPDPRTLLDYCRDHGFLSDEWLSLTPEQLATPVSYRRVPIHDELLANKLLLENDEEQFHQIAIITGMQTYRPIRNPYPLQ